MQLTIHNLTDTVLISHIFAAGEHVLFPNHPTTVKLPKGSENLNLSSCKDILASCDGKWTLPVDQLSVRVKLAFGSSWQEIKVPKDCPLRLYRVRVSTLFSFSPLRSRPFTSDVIPCARCPTAGLPGLPFPLLGPENIIADYGTIYSLEHAQPPLAADPS